MTPRRVIALLLLLLLVVIAAVWLWPRLRLPPLTTHKALELAPVAYAELPGWRTGDPRGALAAFRRSCMALARKNPLVSMGGAGYAGTVGDWLEACRAAPRTPGNAGVARAFFESWFTPLAINRTTEDGLFTGYYEPELRASHSRHGKYQTPIYGVPDDMITVDLGLFRTTLQGQHLSGILKGRILVPYPARAEIDAKGLAAAKVIAWGDDPVAVFFLHIQGSGRARFDDGPVARIAYAAQNGRTYTAIGRTLLREGAMARSDLSMQGIRAWMLAHPKEAQRVMETDEFYIFFSEEPLGDPALGAVGSEGVALTPGASLAVDTAIHALGAPMFLSLDEHSTAIPRNRLMVAQDTGGAIKSAVRGDVFFGVGEKAEWSAGHMKAAGAMFVLLPKPLAAHLAPEFRP